MGTHTTQTSTNQFAPSGMQAYNQMTPAMSSAATGYINSPFSNPFFQAQQQMGTRQAQNLGGTQMSNIANNIRASGLGMGGSSPMALEMMQNQGRANSGLQAQLGFLNPVNNALQLQQNAMGLAGGYKPLQTGETQVQKTGGVGSWLPQIIGGALGAINPLKGLFSGGGGMTPAGGMSAGANQAAEGAFGAPSSGGYGNSYPGGNFPMMFPAGGSMGPFAPQGPQMSNSQYGYGQ